MQHLATLITSLVAFASLAIGYELGFYQGEDCRSAPLGTEIHGPGGCLTTNVGTAQSFTITSTGPIDDPFMVVMFSSDDCNPATVIAYSDSGCLSGGGFLSYEVWDVMDD